MAPGGSFHIPSFSTPPGGITRIGPRLGYLGSVRARAAHLAAVAAALIAPAVAEPRTIELELESGRTGGEVVRDRGAHGGRAVALTGRAGLRLRFLTGSTVASVVLRARRVPCSGPPRLSVALDGRRLGSRRVLLDRLILEMPALPRPSAPPPPPLAAAPASAPAPAAAPTPSPALSAYRNPVFAAPGAPDPMVLDVGGVHSDYFAFSTGGRFPVLRSPDLVSWEAVGAAMTSRPAWAVATCDYHPWAPSVIKRP